MYNRAAKAAAFQAGATIMKVHFASLDRAGGAELQLCLTLLRAPTDKTVELEQGITHFQRQCQESGLCAAITLCGLQNWRSEAGNAHTTLYFSVLPACEDGNGENGNGMSASGSAAYAKIWERYACS